MHEYYGKQDSPAARLTFVASAEENETKLKLNRVSSPNNEVAGEPGLLTNRYLI